MSARWSDWSAGWHQHWSNSGNITQSDEILIYNFSLEWELWATVAICKKKIAKNKKYKPNLIEKYKNIFVFLLYF